MTKLKLVETKQGNPDELTTEFEGKELYLVLKGERIAKRGQPGTVQAGKWISLRPDLEITEGPDLEFIDVIKKSSEPARTCLRYQRRQRRSTIVGEPAPFVTGLVGLLALSLAVPSITGLASIIRLRSMALSN